MPQDIILPDEKEKELASEGSRSFARHLDEEGIKVRIDSDVGGEEVVIPQTMLRLIVDMMTEVSKGNAVTLMPVHMELTTQEAANILHCSRPHLIKLLNQGEIEYEKVGTHRRIKFEDLNKYKIKQKQKERTAAKDLTALSQELDLDQF